MATDSPPTVDRNEAHTEDGQAVRGERAIQSQPLRKKGYLLGKLIGKGTYSKVHLAYFLGDGEKHRMACKVVDTRDVSERYRDKFLMRELKILSQVRHRHVIDVWHILINSSKFYIFMSYACNGTLLRFVQWDGPVREDLAKEWFRQMVSGLRYLHSLDIAHRDLKAENVLLSKHWNIKLADLGFARYCTTGQGQAVLSDTWCGTTAYCAPEIISSLPYNPKISDIWSLGIILFMMLNAALPFTERDTQKLLHEQQQCRWQFCPQLSLSLSPAVKTLVTTILQPEVCARPSLQDIQDSSWLKGKD